MISSNDQRFRESFADPSEIPWKSTGNPLLSLLTTVENGPGKAEMQSLFCRNKNNCGEDFYQKIIKQVQEIYDWKRFIVK